MDTTITNYIKPGAQVRVHEIIKDSLAGGSTKNHPKSSGKGKSRTSVFSGIVLARKHGSEPGASFTVRAVIAGEGVEKVYPLHSPLIANIEIISSPKKISRAKLYYLRTVSPKKARQKLGIAGS